MLDIDVNLKMPPLAEECKQYANGYDILRWPETVAFLQRLGVVLDRPYYRVVVDLDLDASKVYLVQRPSDAGPLPVPDKVETTCQHNEKFRTFAPPHREQE